MGRGNCLPEPELSIRQVAIASVHLLGNQNDLVKKRAADLSPALAALRAP